MNVADEIKKRVTCRDVCQMYGIEVNRAGFACCVVHEEKTPSMKIYEGEGGFHCFGCGATGDVITFVQKLFDVAFLEALTKLNQDFALGLMPDKPLTERQKRSVAQERFEREKARAEKERERQRLEDEYWQAFEVWKTYDDNLRSYEPKSPDEEIKDLYVDAINHISQAYDKVIEAQARWNNYGRYN